MNLFENEPDYIKIDLEGECYIEKYHAVKLFRINENEFIKLWNDHPVEFHEVVMHGKKLKTPRWQQAYGKDYQYTGSKNNALPVSELHTKFLNWSKLEIDTRLNGLLINWYDGKLNHYIGKHRDSTIGLLETSPIVTISLGEERIFRFRPYLGKGYTDIKVNHGDVIIVPWNTNLKYTHEIPKFSRYKGKRISVTLRAYK